MPYLFLTVYLVVIIKFEFHIMIPGFQFHINKGLLVLSVIRRCLYDDSLPSVILNWFAGNVCRSSTTSMLGNINIYNHRTHENQASIWFIRNYDFSIKLYITSQFTCNPERTPAESNY